MHECFSKQFIVMFHERGLFILFSITIIVLPQKVQKKQMIAQNTIILSWKQNRANSHSNCSHFYTKTG